MTDINDLTPEQRFQVLLDGCWVGYTEQWGSATREVIRRAVIEGQRLTEPQLTALFVALNALDGKEMVSLIERKLELEPGKRMTEKPTVVVARAEGSLKMIDAAAVALDDDPSVAPVLMEFKLDGWINGGWGYCETHEGYSNQAICYPAGCFWTVATGSHYMVWVGLDKHVKHTEKGFGTKGINARDVALQTLGEDTDMLAARQKNAKWDAFITLEELQEAAMNGSAASQVFGLLLAQTIAHFS